MRLSWGWSQLETSSGRSSQPRHTLSINCIRTFAPLTRRDYVARWYAKCTLRLVWLDLPAVQGGDVAKKQRKCANSDCNCDAEKGGKYCSNRGEEMCGVTVTKSPYGHAACTATADTAATGSRKH